MGFIDCRDEEERGQSGDRRPGEGGYGTGRTGGRGREGEEERVGRETVLGERSGEMAKGLECIRAEKVSGE